MARARSIHPGNAVTPEKILCTKLFFSRRTRLRSAAWAPTRTKMDEHLYGMK
jgi:hypothetical protein